MDLEQKYYLTQRQRYFELYRTAGAPDSRPVCPIFEPALRLSHPRTYFIIRLSFNEFERKTRSLTVLKISVNEIALINYIFVSIVTPD